MDDDTLTTDAFFDYNVQKVCSITASMATMAFNKFFNRFFNEIFIYGKDESRTYTDTLSNKIGIAMFDSRCFNIPKEEIENCFIWRQQDATRNAIQMLGQTNFSHKELQNKSCNDIQDMLMLQKGINFNDMPTEFKRGVCCRKVDAYKPKVAGDKDSGIDWDTKRQVWYLDKEIPLFTQDREYIPKCIEIAKNK